MNTHRKENLINTFSKQALNIIENSLSKNIKFQNTNKSENSFLDKIFNLMKINNSEKSNDNI